MTTLALIIWPILTLVLALRHSFQKTILFSLIGGFLLLPTQSGWDLPLLPAFNKDSIPAFTLLFLALVLSRTQARAPNAPGAGPMPELPGWIPRSIFVIVALLMIVIGNQMTALTNGDLLSYGPTTLPGLRIYDGFSLILGALTTLVPLFLGRKFFGHPEAHVLLLKALIVAGLGYSLLALFEARMSPRLNLMVYGFFPHSFAQHVRGDGFRPIVFMRHGLELAVFFTTVTLAAFSVWRSERTDRRGLYLLVGIWLLATLFLLNSLGALMIALVFLPAVVFLNRSAQLLFAAIIGGIILLYPMLRGADLVPTERLVAMAASIDGARASSLDFRFENEDILLNHAEQRRLFGWGSWNRHRVFDNETGEDLTTTDGAWVVIIGQKGWVGYLAIFGLLTAPAILLAANRRRYEVAPATVALSLVLTAALLDLLPNGFLSPLTLLLAGALWGRLELGPAAQEAGLPVAASSAPAPSQWATASPRSGSDAGSLTAAPDLSNADSADDTGKVSAYTRQKVRHRRFEHPQ